MGEYDWLFYKYPNWKHSDGLLPPVQAYFRGASCMPGSQIYAPYRAYMKAGVIDRELIIIVRRNILLLWAMTCGTLSGPLML
jgi:hypothetical protein